MTQELRRRQRELRAELRRIETRLAGQENAHSAFDEPPWREQVARAPQFLMLMDDDLNFRFVNRTREGRDDPTGGSALAFLPPDYHDTLRHAAGQARSTGTPQYFELEAKGPDDQNSWYSNWVIPLPAHAAPATLAVISADVTDELRVRSELENERDSLRRSEERFRTLVEHAPEALVILDVDSGRFVEVNENACRLFAMSREELLTRGPEAVSPPRQPDGSPSNLGAMARIQDSVMGRHPAFEWTHQDAHGSIIPCEVRLVRLPDRNRRLVRGSILDISARKQAEAERERLSTELAQAQKVQAIGQLTGGVAHDFNNLLTIIISSAEMIELRPDNADSVVSFTGQILRAAQRGASLTSRLLAFARRQPLRPEVIDVNRLLAGMEELLRRTLGADVTIETVLGGGLWSCEADPAQLENVILNLSINARDAMPAGGSLTIETANAHLDRAYAREHDEAEAGQYVLLAVSDNGTGMDSEILQYAFEPFFTTKRSGEGSGLGLSMVYGFVKQSGGHVKIYSESGAGTTVKVYLPRYHSPAPATNPVRRAGTTPEGDGSLILVVEDDADVRSLVVAELQGLGYRTLDAGDADTALTLLQEADDLALLLTDVVLSGATNGAELAQRVQALRPELPALFMSGYTENSIIRNGRLDPDRLLLQKPFTRQELAIAVHSALETVS